MLKHDTSMIPQITCLRVTFIVSPMGQKLMTARLSGLFQQRLKKGLIRPE
jgi:hypothetical protein